MCDDDLENMKGHLFKCDSWDSVLSAFNVKWQRCACHGHMARSEWWMPLFCSRDF